MYIYVVYHVKCIKNDKCYERSCHTALPITSWPPTSVSQETGDGSGDATDDVMFSRNCANGQYGIKENVMFRRVRQVSTIAGLFNRRSYIT